MTLRNSRLAISLGGAALICAVSGAMLLGFAWKGLVGLLLAACIILAAVWGWLSYTLSDERQAVESELSGAEEGGRR